MDHLNICSVCVVQVNMVCDILSVVECYRYTPGLMVGEP